MSTTYSPTFYNHYTRLFSAYFKEVPNNVVNELSLAGSHCYEAVLAMDRIIDDGKTQFFTSFVHAQEESIKRLGWLFEKNSEFWTKWEERRNEYFKAVEIEKSIFKTNKPFSFTDYADLASKKGAFGKIAIDALHVLSNQKDLSLYECLLQSHDHFSLGFQLYDDVQDFIEDLEKGQFNWGVKELKHELGVRFDQLDPKILNKYLYLCGIGQSMLGEAIKAFEKSYSVIGGFTVQSDWETTIKETQSIIKYYLDSTTGYIKTLEKKLDLTKGKKIANYTFFNYSKVEDKCLKEGLDYLLKQCQHNYSDLKHIMYLSKLEDFENKEDIHISDTFQRALFANCMVRIASKQNLEITKYLDHECNYLIDRTMPGVIGAWSYFPTVKEIAADIDDLAEIMQLFLNAEKTQHIYDYASAAITIALTDNQHVSGGVETWIIPKHNRTNIQQKQYEFNVTKWGKGPDVEVVANFAYALNTFDSIEYEDSVQKMTNYVVQQQAEEGYWASRWYYGNLYGTYVCLRLLLSNAKKYSPSISKVKTFLEANQNEDGGYSLDGNSESDPLSTAFALCCLKMLVKSSKSLHISKATCYLKSIQKNNGAWTPINFIKPKAGEPFQSTALTTAFVLSALHYE